MSPPSLRRSRFRVRVPDEDPLAPPEADPEVRSRSSAEGSTDPGEYEAELESMTGKGIKRLCSELLELKKASDEDFRRSLYSNYSAFIRIFEEIGDVESEIMELKKHASTQAKLIQTLMNNFYADMIVDGLEEPKVEDLGLSSPSRFGIHMQDALVTLDILLSEYQLKEALPLLEKETVALQKLKTEEDCSSPIITSYTHALSERRTRLADQLASMADHRRVSQPELQMALSGLCRLGENHRANSLLIKFYRSRLEEKVNELQCSNPCSYGTHIREQVKVVFSAISQAARSFGMLYGENSPYSSELILWVREETENFGRHFYKYVHSISEMNGGLSLAAEAAISAVSLCSLLKSQRIVLLPNLLESVRPCMEEVLQMHVDQLKKVVHVFTTTENWTLGKFLTLGILRDTSPLSGIGDKVEYCLLTSSGRKFITLMQAMVDDISPLVTLGMGTSILKGLADLFSEYMSALERAIPSRGNAVESDSPKVSLAQTLPEQLSLLANTAALVHLFPSISCSIAKGIKSSDDDLLSEKMEIFSQNELDDWIMSIEEAADKLPGLFCQQFVYGLMSHEDFESTTHSTNWFVPCSSQDPAPSFAFQALCVRLRQLEQLSKSIFVGEDGLTEKLLKEIVETVIIWLSNNQYLWIETVQLSCIGRCSCLEQVYLDMHLLVEIAMLGGYCSNDLIVAVMDLIEEMEVAFAKTGSVPNGVVPDREWATNAAKLAIKKLLKAESADLEPEAEPVATSLKDSTTQDGEDECPSEGSVDVSEGSSVLLDGKYEKLIDDEVRRFVVPKSFEGRTSDDVSDDYDDDGSRSPPVPYSDGEDGDDDAEKAVTGSVGLSESEDTMHLGFEGLAIKSEGQSIGNLNEFDSAQQIADELKVNLKNELLENSLSRGRKGIEEVEAGVLTTNPEGQLVGSLDESATIAAKHTIEEERDISRKELSVTETDLLEPGRIREADGTQELDDKQPNAYSEMEPFGILSESGVTGLRLPTDELLDLAKIENPLLIEVEGMKRRGVGELTVYAEVKTVDKFDGCELGGDDYSFSMLEPVQDDGPPKVKDEPAVVEPLDSEAGDKLLSDNFSELTLETSLQNQVGDNIDPVEGSGSNSSGSGNERGVRKRSKALVSSFRKNGKEQKRAMLEDDDTPFTVPEEHVVGGESAQLEPQSIDTRDKPSEDSAGQKVVRRQFKRLGPRKNDKGSNGSGLKILLEANRPSDVLAEPAKLELEREIAKLEGHTSPVPAVSSELEGEPHTILDYKQLSGNFSQLILATSPQNHGEDGVTHVEDSGTPSGGSAGQRALIKQHSLTAAPSLRRNGEGSNGGAYSKIFAEAHDPVDDIVNSNGFDLEEEIVMLDENIRLSSMLKELVQGDDSNVDVGAGSSYLAVERSVQKHGKDIVGTLDDDKSIISIESLLHREEPHAADSSGVKPSCEVKNSSADRVNSGNLDFEKKLVLLEADSSLFIESEEHAQVDSSKPPAESAEQKLLSTGEGEKLLSVKFSELAALETGLQKQGLDSNKPVGSVGNTRQRGGRKRTKSISEENAGKSGKGAKALRPPRWH